MNDGTILMVEDDPDDEALILRALKKFNIGDEITVVRDGAEALDYLFKTGPYADREDGNPSVVLLDLKLPKIDGLAVADIPADNLFRGITSAAHSILLP